MRVVRLPALLLAVLLLAPASPVLAQSSAGFVDVDDTVHAANIDRIADRGVTRGCDPEGTRFCPDEPVSRAQMASFLVRALDLPPSSRDAFRDDDGMSAEDDINALAAAGITSGCEDGRYCPARNVRRDQMATFLVAGFDLAASRVDFFADDNRNVHRDNIGALAAAGITTGCNDLQSRYCPHRSVNRAQMATFLARGLELAPRSSVDPVMEVGDRGPRVAALQRRLRSLGYWVGSVDGIYGNLTQQAMFAFQKAQRLSPDGVYGPNTRNRLENPRAVGRRSSSGFVVEIDKDRQILTLVRNGTVEWVFNTSTGTEQPYTHEGRRYLADTPPGKWTITRQVNGWRDGELGHLYRPKYFHHDGIAIHGYHSVPPYPASHGCARVSMDAIDWMWNRIPIGTRVWVY
jgi:lipoprotein-anchoring transpeptidase ErfK/SrfK